MTTAEVTQCPMAFYHIPDEYWEMAEKLRSNGRLPEWAFDFLSIHRNDRVTTDGKPYSLLGPSRLAVNSSRPSFERLRFRTFTEAKRKAISLAKRMKFSVVNCIPETV